MIAKWAQTAEGYMCPPPDQGRWITGIASRTEVHRLRGRVDAVLTGVGTVKADDCRLDPRLYRPRQIPMVAVASRSGPIPQSASIQNNTNNIHLTGSTPAEQLAAAGQDEHPSRAAGSRADPAARVLAIGTDR